MNLIISQRSEGSFVRFLVRGSWAYNDALALAYKVKSAALRDGVNRALIDLREVRPSSAVEGKFLVWDRLRRALPAGFKIALLGPPALVDLQERNAAGTPSVVLFTSERAALLWLEGVPEGAIKNPPVAWRSEGQIAGKET